VPSLVIGKLESLKLPALAFCNFGFGASKAVATKESVKRKSVNQKGILLEPYCKNVGRWYKGVTAEVDNVVELVSAISDGVIASCVYVDCIPDFYVREWIIEIDRSPRLIHNHPPFPIARPNYLTSLEQFCEAPPEEAKTKLAPIARDVQDCCSQLVGF
jgi:hypothetical protein